MNAKEWEAWLKRNAPIPGMPRSYDQFNRSSKGTSFHSAPEYAMMHVDERHSYPSTVDLRERETEEEEQPQQPSIAKKKQKNSGSKARSSTRSVAKSIGNVATKVMVAVGGAAVVVTGYTALAEIESSQPPLVAKLNWTWAEDNLSASAKLYDSEDIYLKELPAVVKDEHLEATCTQDGNITYTATIKDDDDSIYTDKHIVVLPALGHIHDEGVEEHLENGDTVITYECTRCHEKIVITISGAEEEI